MMALATEEYSLPPSTKNDNAKEYAPFLNFEPYKLVEGESAIGLASKYFPMLVRRLQVRDIMDERDDGSRSLDDVMVIIGEMQVSVPASFVVASTEESDY